MPSSKDLFGSKEELSIEEIKLSDEQMKLLSWIIKSKEKFNLKFVDKKKVDIFMENAPKYAKPDYVFEIEYKETGKKIIKN